MAIISLDAKIVNKRSTVAAEVPTVAPSNDHTDGTWDNLDIYSGEFFINEPDDKLYIRIANNIREINLGAGADTIYTADGTIPVPRTVSIAAGANLRFSTGGNDVTISQSGNISAGLSLLTIGSVEAGTGGYGIQGDTGLKIIRKAANIWHHRAALNYAVMSIEESTIKGVSITGAAFQDPVTPVASLTVRGAQNTDATGLVEFQSLSGAAKFKIRDNGQLATGSGQAAIVSASFGQIHRASNYQFGFGFYSAGGVTTAMTVQHTGNIVNPVAFEAAFQGAKTGTAVAGSFRGIATGTTTQKGIDATARNASTLVEGIRGTAGGGDSVIAAQYLAGVVGAAASSVDNEQYAVYGLAQYNAAGTNYTKDLIGIKGNATGTTGAAGSTGHVIGGEFSTTGTAGTGNRIALSVPDTGNNGVVLFGADAGALTTSEALLELAATDKAFLIMRMTAAQAGAITPVNGMMLYVTTTDLTFIAVGFWGYEAGAWVKL